jgi:two-component sensor histidine kinase
LHRKLYTSDDVRSVDIDSYLETLVEEIESSMRQTGHLARIRLDLDSFAIATDKAVAIGMIVTELLTNAYKYAYPDNVAGEVRVSMKRCGDNRARLTVEDDGVGWNGTGKAQGTGLGTRIVQAMAHTMGGSITYGDGRSGTRTSVEVVAE